MLSLRAGRLRLDYCFEITPTNLKKAQSLYLDAMGKLDATGDKPGTAEIQLHAGPFRYHYSFEEKPENVKKALEIYLQASQELDLVTKGSELKRPKPKGGR